MKTAPPYTLGKPNRVITNNYFPPFPTGFITIYFWLFPAKDWGVGERMP